MKYIDKYNNIICIESLTGHKNKNGKFCYKWTSQTGSGEILARNIDEASNILGARRYYKGGGNINEADVLCPLFKKTQKDSKGRATLYCEPCTLKINVCIDFINLYCKSFYYKKCPLYKLSVKEYFND